MIISLLLLSVMLLSVSVAFAADEDVTLSENDDITIDEDVLAIEEDSDENSIQASEDSQTLQASETVTNSTFHKYFNQNGQLYNNVTADELVFEGDFPGIDVNLIAINKTITLTGTNAIFTDVQFSVFNANNVMIKGFKITGKDLGTAISIVDSNNVIISDNIINITDPGAYDCYGIYAINASALKILDNTIYYVGNTTGDTINNIIGASNINNSEIKRNKIYAKLVSAPVKWVEEPPGSWNYVGYPTSEGIVVVDSDKVDFDSNLVDVSYNNVVGYYDTIYSIDFKNVNNARITLNNISSKGKNYIYGIIITGNDFTISKNNITSTSENYANGIDVEGPATGEVNGNIIDVTSPVSAYGIYSGMNGQNTTVKYANNKISGKAYNIFGMSLGDVESNINGAEIMLDGNYTTGIAYRGSNLTLENSKIVLTSSEVGNQKISESFGVEAVGVKVIQGKALIKNNTIATAGKGISITTNKTVANLEDNFINVVGNTDKDAYAIYAVDTPNATVSNNTIDYQGTTYGTGVNFGVYFNNAENALIFENTFDFDLVSSYVPWAEVPAGSGIWVSSPISEGIVIENSKGVAFDGNKVNVTFGDVLGSYDTIYSVDFINSDDAVITGNNITSEGNTYIYGLKVTGNDFIIRGNNIDSTGKYYANGIDVEGPATGVIEDNNITVTSPVSAYGIYSGMNGQAVKVNYTTNKISGKAYNIFGMSLGDVESNIAEAEIILEGNYTTGIAYRGSNLTLKDSRIVLTSSEVGDESIWEAFGVEAVGVKVIQGNALIKNNTIATPGKGISLTTNATSADLEENFINVVANTDKDAYAVYAVDVSKLTINKNDVDYQGATNGTGINNAILIDNVANAAITSNNFTLDLVSSYVPWAEVPAGSGNWVSSPISEGIVVKDSNGAILKDNTVDVTYGDVSGVYDTIYSVDFKNSDNAVISNNNITSTGKTYIYGIVISGDNFTIEGNNINSTSEYYANGIDVEGPATGLISKNKIVATAPELSYPIYGAMSNGDVSADIKNNDIEGNAYLVYAIQISGKKSAIENNNIVANGNHTIGIGSRVEQLTVDNNTIVSNASNEGNKSVWEGMGTTTEGILIKAGDAVITNNNVTTTGDEAIKSEDNAIIAQNNNLTAKNATGSKAINGTNVNERELNVTLTGSDLVKVYGDNDQYIVKVTDENGKAVVGKVISASIKGQTLQATTDSNGIAKFDMNLDAGNYTVDVSFAGTVVYAANTTSNKITITIKGTAITAPGVSLLTTAVKSGYNYKITLKDASGNALANKSVAITFNGKTVSVNTDANGEIIYKLVATKAANYPLTVKFDGDNNYAASTATATIKITKEATKVNAKKKTFKAKKKTKKYTATLKDSKGKAISKAKLTLKIKNKKYTAKTNAKGKATFKIKKLNKKGTYKGKVTYAGNDLYKASSKKVKITVKK